jgi:hypothetical protein
MSEKPTQADLDKADNIVFRQYQQFRAGGGTAPSPYLYFLTVQSALRRSLELQGRGSDFKLYELLVVRDDGTQVVVDLRYLAPDIFGEPDDG